MIATLSSVSQKNTNIIRSFWECARSNTEFAILDSGIGQCFKVPQYFLSPVESVH